MLEPQNPTEVLRRSRDLLLLTILALAALLFSADLKPSMANLLTILGLDPVLFSSQHTTTAFPKATAFYVLVWLALILEFFFAYREGFEGFRAWRPMLVCLGGFLVWCAISAIWVAPIPRSFRELSRWVALISLFVVSIGAGRSAWFRRQILWFGTLLPFVVALYACMQGLGWDPFIWPKFEWEREFRRVTGTLGNPDFLAGYLLAMIPLSVAYGLTATRIWPKVLSGVSVAFQLAIIVLTLSRGVWIGFLCSVAALLVILPNRRRFVERLVERWKRPKIAAASAGVLLVAGLVLWPAISNLYVRLAGGSDVSLGGRYHIYVSCLRLAAGHPVLGVGLDAFPVRFPETRTPELSQYLPFNKWYVEHAHSEPLEVLVDLGIVGFVLWVGILAFWGRTTVARLRGLERRESLLVGAVWVAAIGILGHNLVTVTLRHTSSAVPFWAFLGIAVGASERPGMARAVRRPNGWRWIVLALLVAGAPLVWLHGSREYQADRYLYEAHGVIGMVLNEERHSLKVEPCHAVLDLLARADRLVPTRKESLYWRAWAYYELGDYEASRAEYERTIRLEGPFVDSVPNVGKVLLNLAQDYMQAGFPGRALTAYRDSLYWWEWACRMEPEKAQHWRGSASALGMLGRIDEAKDAFRRALDLEGDPIQKQRIYDLMQRLDTDAEALRKQAQHYSSEGLDQ